MCSGSRVLPWGHILEKREALAVPLNGPDFPWFWFVTASPVAVTATLEAGSGRAAALCGDG